MAAEWNRQGRRLIVTWCPKRAKKDRHDREEAVARVEKTLSKGGNLRKLQSKASVKRYVVVEGKARMVDDNKIAQEARWDGLSGIETNQWEAPASEILSQHHGRWQVDEIFRIAKSDLRVRPIFHWSEARIRAHMAIFYMANAILRQLAYRASKPDDRMSPKRIRRALMSRDVSYLHDTASGKRYRLPSNPTPDARRIYSAMGKTLDRYISEVN